MHTFLDDLKKFDDEVNAVVRKYLDAHITCILLHHAGCRKIQENDAKTGEIILGFIPRMCKAVDGLRAHCAQTLGEKRLQHIFARIAYDKLLYSSLSDAVLLSSAERFAISPRPPGPEYLCDEAVCKKNIDALLQKYFSP